MLRHDMTFGLLNVHLCLMHNLRNPCCAMHGLPLTDLAVGPKFSSRLPRGMDETANFSSGPCHVVSCRDLSLTWPHQKSSHLSKRLSRQTCLGQRGCLCGVNVRCAFVCVRAVLRSRQQGGGRDPEAFLSRPGAFARDGVRQRAPIRDDARHMRELWPER